MLLGFGPFCVRVWFVSSYLQHVNYGFGSRVLFPMFFVPSLDEFGPKYWRL